MAMLNVANWVDCTEVEGPGKRFAMWMQGCLLQCPGCCNPHMFDFSPRTLVNTEEVLEWIQQAKLQHQIEGITFLGGEPVLQAQGLSNVAKTVRTWGLSVMLFTGYRIDDLRQMGLPGAEELLAQCDLVVDGPYIASRPEPERNWVGSTNQRFNYLSPRYSTDIELNPSFGRGIEVRINSQSDIRLNGWPFGHPAE